MATRAAYNEFRRVYSDPAAALRSDEFDTRSAHYALLWSYHENSAFDSLAAWSGYRSRYRLYRFSRSIYNPVRRLVDFYVGNVFQGAWPMTTSDMVERTSAVPFADDTDAQMLQAIAQFWEWSNWPAQSSVMVRWGAALGDVMVVLVDDLERAKIYAEVVYPGHVAEVQLNPSGDVVGYTLEYEVEAEDGVRTYVYRREVDKASIRTYRDNQPHDFGDGAVVANPYGFVPAVWVNHVPLGGVHGAPAVRNASKIDEVNGLASHALDQAHRILEAPILVAGDNIQSSGIGSAKSPQSGSSTAANADALQQESIKLITAESGATVDTIRMEPGEALEHIEQMLREIEADHPELTMYSKLREMSSVTGPGADRMFGDVLGLVNAARSQYDRQVVKLCQMAVAIGGYRQSSGAWRKSGQQGAFAGFNLDSYAAGDLQLSIKSRGLSPASEQEELELERLRLSIQSERTSRQMRSENGDPAAIAARLRAMVGRE